MRRFHSIVLLLALTLGAPAVARAAPDDTQEEEEGGLLQQASLFASGSKVPWRGSQLVLRNAFTAISVDRGVDQTYNPYYAMTWSLRPWWWFTDKIFARAVLDIEDELTEADDTTYDGEALLQDLRLVAGGSSLYTIPYAKINVSADLVLTLPTSKASQARTMILGIGPGFRLSRSFPLLKGLVVGYNMRLTPRLFSFTTAESDNPRILTCRPGDPRCFVGTGHRNPYLRFAQTVDASIKILDWLGASMALGHAIDWIYDPSPTPRGVEISYQAAPDQDRQYLTFFELAVSFRPLKELEVGVGLTALHPQLRPESSYYVPFFNRYSAFFVDLKVHAEAVVTRVRRIMK